MQIEAGNCEGPPAVSSSEYKRFRGDLISDSIARHDDNHIRPGRRACHINNGDVSEGECSLRYSAVVGQ